MKSPQVAQKLYDVRMDCIFDCINNLFNGRCIFSAVFPHKHAHRGHHKTPLYGVLKARLNKDPLALFFSSFYFPPSFTMYKCCNLLRSRCRRSG